MIKIVGDIILDKWVNGEYSKYSPEAPVKILEQLNVSYNLGGAANVAANIREYDKDVKLYGSIANDYSGKKIISLLNEKKIKNYLSKKLNITTTKTRLTKKNGKHILRIDQEEISNSKQIENNLIKNLKKNDLILIVDYKKGLITKDLFNKIFSINKKIYVDPKNKPNFYNGAYLVKPNMKRVIQWIGNFNKKNCFKLLKKNNWEWLIVTDGPKGVHIFNKQNYYKRILVKTKNLKDVSGAGDTFLATLAYFNNIGLDIPQACKMAAKASTKVVEKIGVKTVEKNELLFNKVFTNGVFDLLHKGHYELFKFCKKIGKELIVGINSDLSVKKIKGNARPINNLKKRIFNLKKIKEINKIISFKKKTPLELISKMKPDVIVKGGDYKPRDVVGNKLTEIFIFPYIKGYSTTKMIKKLKK